jgi:hypothetical protein
MYVLNYSDDDVSWKQNLVKEAATKINDWQIRT